LVDVRLYTILYKLINNSFEISSFRNHSLRPR
jgi:hypothetical protein